MTKRGILVINLPFLLLEWLHIEVDQVGENPIMSNQTLTGTRCFLQSAQISAVIFCEIDA